MAVSERGSRRLAAGVRARAAGRTGRPPARTDAVANAASLRLSEAASNANAIVVALP